jgi:hypothetical protein
MFTVLLLSAGLAAGAPAPSQTSVPALVKQLSSEDAKQRDRAAAKLWAEIEKALPHLLKARKRGDPRGREEALKLLVKYYTQQVRSAAPGLAHQVPWLDMLPPDYPNRDLILRKYVPLAGYGHAGTGWDNYRQATLLFLAERMTDEGWDAKQVRGFMEMLAVVEHQWCRDNNYTQPAGRQF